MGLRVEAAAGGHRLVGSGGDVELVNRFLAHLSVRNLSAATRRAYAFDLLSFLRFCEETGLTLAGVGPTDVFDYLGWPIFMKPAYGGGWKDVYKVHDPQEFFAAYDQTRDLVMMAQEAIEFELYYRCYVLGRSRVRIMAYDPKSPFHERYVKNPPPMDPAFEARINRDALALCEGLGYDMNTVEFAVRDGIPYAIDFMNCAPDADLNSVGQENFDWMVTNMAEVLIEMVREEKKFELTGNWPTVMNVKKDIATPVA